MLSRQEVLELMQDRIDDAEALLNANRIEAAYYLCGYGVELALKARIVQHLKWNGLPEKNEQDFGIINKHDLDYLLRFTGIEAKIKPKLQAEWSLVTQWDPEHRYKLSVTNRQDARDMLDAAKRLIQVITQ